MSKRWRDPISAARLVARLRGESLGVGMFLLREAMASGDVRLREGGSELPAELFGDAQFDPDDKVIGWDQWAHERGLNERQVYDALEINADDLRGWVLLLEPPAAEAAAPRYVGNVLLWDIPCRIGRPAAMSRRR